ncbi:MAG: efflux RND transporter periplasmic adaptor subunit [Acidobacteria bacterium]|nr:efflux RND transporter periplasmic adaptor subunit [Acidobacteriota bacterium]
MNKVTNKAILLILIILSLTFTACQPSQSPAQADTSTKPSVDENPPKILEVSTAPVVERTLSSVLELTGTLEGQEEVIIASELDGKISDMHIDLGSYVKKGDKLFSLDSRELSWKVDQAQATLKSAELALGQAGKPSGTNDQHPAVRDAYAALEKAKIDFERTEKLLRDGIIARQEYDRTKSLYDQTVARWESSVAQVDVYRTNITQARASLELAQKQLNDSIIYAPIGGSIKERLVSAGEYVKKGQAVARIIQLNPLRLRTNVPEQYLQQIKLGEAVKFQVDSLPDKKFQGIVSRFSPALDKSSRSLMIEASIANNNLELKPGMFARIKLSFAPQKSALMVPEKAVLTTVGLKKVYIFVDGKAQAREVSLGQKEGDLVEVLGNLKTNEIVITSNLDKLADGSQVVNK